MLIKQNQLINLGLFFLLLHPFNLYILNTFHIYQFPLTILALMFFICSSLRFSKHIEGVFGWSIFFSYLAIRNVNYNDLIMYYFICLIVMIILSEKYDWRKGYIKTLLVLTAPHVIVTNVLFLVPSIYSYLRPLISANAIMFEGYKTGLTGHYSTNAIYLACGVLILGVNLFNTTDTGKKKKNTLLIFLIELFGLILTTKRGPLLFSLAALFITYIITDRRVIAKRIVKILLISVVFIVFLYITASFIPAMVEVVKRFSRDGTSGREGMYKLALSMFFRSPIIGCGTGSYRINFFYKLAIDSEHLYLNAHNVYLQLLAENGIIGLGIFLVVSGATLFRSIKLLRFFHTNGLRKEEEYLSTSVVFQVFFLLYCITGNPLYDSMVYMPYFIFCSLSYSFHHELKRKQNIKVIKT